MDFLSLNKLTKNIFKYKNRLLLFYLSTLLVVFWIPLYKKWLPIIIVFWIFTWIISIKSIKQFRKLFKNKPLYLLIAFYLIHAISLLYSNHIKEGWFDLQVKLSLLIFPIIIGTNSLLFVKRSNSFLFSFIIGNVAAIIICLFFGIFLTESSKNNIFYANISLFHNPTYFAMYIVFCIAILLTKVFINSEVKKRYFILIIILIIFLFLLSSKAGFLSFSLSIVLISFYYFFSTKKTINALLFLLFIFIFGFLVLNSNYRVKIFTYNFVNDLKEIKINPKSNEVNINTYSNFKIKLEKLAKKNNDIRVALWFSALQTINDNLLFGVGVGDQKEELLNNSVLRNNKNAKSHNYNSHNQFLDTFVVVGIIGGLLLLYVFTLLFIHGIKNKDILVILFTIITASHFFTESMLCTIAGIVFFTFFYCFLSIKTKS